MPDFFNAHGWDALKTALEAISIVIGVVSGIKKFVKKEFNDAAADAIRPVEKRIVEHEQLDDKRHAENIGRLLVLDKGQEQIIRRLDHRRP